MGVIMILINIHCCHCVEGGGQVILSSLLVFSQTLTVQYSVFNKTQIKYLEHFITIKYFRRNQTFLARF